MSLLPALKRLNPKKNAEARIKFQQALYETEFSDSRDEIMFELFPYFFSSVSAPNSMSSISNEQEPFQPTISSYMSSLSSSNQQPYAQATTSST
jgi:hypothetical protein